MQVQEIEQKKVEAFGEKMLGVLNGGALALMISIGHRTRLFDRMASMPPATSKEIADEAHLNERYVREWLGAMVVGGIVDYDPEDQQYFLPREHAALLTRKAYPQNAAATLQFIGILGSVESRIVDCFVNGGGLSYGEYPCFHCVMAEDSDQNVVSALFETILPLVPGIEDRLATGIDVADFGCGKGHALLAMAARFPNSRFTGFDFSPEVVESGNREVEKRRLTNIRFVRQDVALSMESEKFDFITAFDAIHDQAKPAEVLSNIRNSLREKGVFLMQDIRASSHVENNMENPVAPFLYTISTMHCMSVSLSANGAGLGTVWGEELAVQMLQKAGFNAVSVHKPEHDIMNNFYVTLKT